MASEVPPAPFPLVTRVHPSHTLGAFLSILREGFALISWFVLVFVHPFLDTRGEEREMEKKKTMNHF